MALWEDVFRAHSPMGGLITAAGARPRALEPLGTSAEPAPPAEPEPETENPFMQAIHGVGSALGAIRKPIDWLASAASGVPGQTVGGLAKAALLPNEELPSNIVHGKWYEPLAETMGLGLIGSLEHLREISPKAADVASAPARAVIETGANLATDPLTYASFGTGTLGRAAAGTLAGVGGVQAAEGAKQAYDVLGREGLTPEAIEAATSAGLGVGMAGLGLKHALRGPEPIPAVEPRAKVAPKVEVPPEGVAPEPQPTPLSEPIEQRIEERRQGVEPAPALGDRRLSDRRAKIAAETGLPEEHPAIERVIAAETDPLTSLPTRAAFERDAASHQGGIATFDIGGLKYVNDSLGANHAGGDAMLKAFGDALQSEPGVNGYRTGGDEFHLLADSPEAAEAAATSVRERFRDATFRLTLPDGSVREYTGGEATHGVAPVEPGKLSDATAAADAELAQRRQIAEDLGLRSPRGSKPSGLAEVVPAGEQVGSAPAPVEAASEQPAVSPAPQRGPIKPIPPAPEPTPAGGEAAVVRSLLEQSKPIRERQEQLYSEERGRRFGSAAEAIKGGGGEAAFTKAFGAMKGELPKASFEPIRQHLSEEQQTNLFDAIGKAKLTTGEQLTAAKALQKILDPTAPSVPQRAELAVLDRVFGPELSQAVLAKRSTGAKLKSELISILNIPRRAIVSFDMGAPLRTGLVLMAHSPSKVPGAFGEMVKNAFSEKNYQQFRDEVLTHPLADEASAAGLHISSRTESGIYDTTERTVTDRILTKLLPFIRMSDRAQMTFLDKMRMDSFAHDMEVFAKDHERLAGQPLSAAERATLARSEARLLNVASGHGSLGALEPAGRALSTVLFSPRLNAARLQMFNPFFYKSLSAPVRKAAILDMVKLGSTGVAVLALAKARGAAVEDDPRSSDFGKIRVGKVRFDIWGGFQPWVRFAAQLNPMHPTETGERKKLSGVIAKEPRSEIAGRFITQKLSPQASIILDMLRGKTATGQPLDLKDEAWQRLMVLFAQDMKEVAQENPSLIPPSALFSFFGGGVQAYDAPGTPTPMSRYLSDELSRLGYTPEEPSNRTSVKGRQITLDDGEVRVLKKFNMKASDEARRLIRTSGYRRLSDTDREYALKRVFEKWRSRGHERIKGGVQKRYRDLPREPSGPTVGG